MRDWIVRNLPIGFELTHYRGVQPGDSVSVFGWRHPGSVDVRTVVRLMSARFFQSGVAVELDAPLHNQPRGERPLIDFRWLRVR